MNRKYFFILTGGLLLGFSLAFWWDVYTRDCLKFLTIKESWPAYITGKLGICDSDYD
jgi:hypothetical protein